MIIVKNLDGFGECDFVILFILASLLRIPFEYKHSDSWGNLRGRDAGYPAPPAQTPACSFPAPGSSVALASALQM